MNDKPYRHSTEYEFKELNMGNGPILEIIEVIQYKLKNLTDVVNVNVADIARLQDQFNKINDRIDELEDHTYDDYRGFRDHIYKEIDEFRIKLDQLKSHPCKCDIEDDEEVDYKHKFELLLSFLKGYQRELKDFYCTSKDKDKRLKKSKAAASDLLYFNYYFRRYLDQEKEIEEEYLDK